MSTLHSIKEMQQVIQTKLYTTIFEHINNPYTDHGSSTLPSVSCMSEKSHVPLAHKWWDPRKLGWWELSDCEVQMVRFKMYWCLYIITYICILGIGPRCMEKRVYLPTGSRATHKSGRPSLLCLENIKGHTLVG